MPQDPTPEQSADLRPGTHDRPAAGTSLRASGLMAVAVGIVVAILPTFLLGSLSFQIREDLGYGEATAGLIFAAFFAASAAVSSWVGRWVDRVGPRQALSTALAGTTAIQLLIALGARNAALLALFSTGAGMCNATAQLGANVFIGRALPVNRQGVGFAVKQSAMPGASLVAGLSLPAVAVPLGWRPTFALASALTAAALWWVRVRLDRVPRPEAPGPARSPDADTVRERPPRGLIPMAVAAAFATAAAITFGGFFVESAIDTGVDPGTAGLIFSLGSLVSIVVRMGVGVVADRRRGDLLGVVAVMLALGALTSVWFTWRTPLAHLVGVPLAFGAGWAWPGLFNLSVVRAAPRFPGQATGITQTGTYVGGAIGPVLFGSIAESWSYGAAWILAAVLGLAAAAAVLYGRRSLRREAARTAGLSSPNPSTRP